jgi:aryl-alcohol dehydrogenase-like predicted oxidoreductase
MNTQPENNMEYRNLGSSGLKVPALSFGAGTFGGNGPLFSHWGDTDVAEAQNLPGSRRKFI